MSLEARKVLKSAQVARTQESSAAADPMEAAYRKNRAHFTSKKFEFLELMLRSLISKKAALPKSPTRQR